MANTDDNDLHELRFDNVEAPPSSMFSLGPPSATDPVDDSGMIDDNDLTTSLLPRQGEDNAESGGLNASQIVAAASRPHSGVRLVMRKIGNFLATFTLITMLVVIPIVTYRALSKRKLDIAAFDSAAVTASASLRSCVAACIRARIFKLCF